MPSFRRPVAETENRSPATSTAIFADTFLVSFDHTWGHRHGESSPLHSRQTFRSEIRKSRASFPPLTSRIRSDCRYGIFLESCGEFSQVPTSRYAIYALIILCRPTFGRRWAWQTMRPTRWCISHQGRSTTSRLPERLPRLPTPTRSQNTDSTDFGTWPCRISSLANIHAFRISWEAIPAHHRRAIRVRGVMRSFSPLRPRRVDYGS